MFFDLECLGPNSLHLIIMEREAPYDQRTAPRQPAKPQNYDSRPSRSPRQVARQHKVVKKNNNDQWFDATRLTIGLLASLAFIFMMYFIFGDHRSLKDIPINEESVIDSFNKNKHDYSIKFSSFFEGMSLKQITNLFKPSLTDKTLAPKCDTNDFIEVIVPDRYNFYEQYPDCRFNDIQHRGASGYVEIPTSVFRSRYCMLNMGKDFEPSSHFLLRCDATNEGTKNGFLNRTLDFILRNGFINQKCWFSLKREQNKCPADQELKKCERYEMDRYCFLEDSISIKKEIFKNGPVIGVMEPYTNFLLYERGVFNFDRSRKLKGSVFVKIIGWGKDDEFTEYWLVETSWGRNWGEGGLGKVRMNVSGSSLDELAIALYPKTFMTKSDVK